MADGSTPSPPIARSLPAEEAEAAASGWRGDRIAYYVSGANTSYLWRLRYENATAAARFESALRRARTKKPVPQAETIRRDGTDVIVAAGLPKVPELP